jgi:hypothetical protein
VVGALAAPWTAPLALLVFIGQLVQATGVKVGEGEAKVILAFARLSKRRGRTVAREADILEELTRILARRDLEPPTPAELRESLRRLAQIRTVRHTNEDRWRLEETIVERVS